MKSKKIQRKKKVVIESRELESNKARARELWKTGWTYIRYVVDTAREPFFILDKNLRILVANESFYATFKVSKRDTEKKYVFRLGNGQWDIPQLRKLLKDILPKHTFFKDFEVEHTFPSIGRRIMVLNARRIYEGHNNSPMLPPLIILAMEDVTRERLMEEKLVMYAKELETRVGERTREIQSRVVELERLNKTMIGRELKMIELKKQINTLTKRSKTKKR